MWRGRGGASSGPSTCPLALPSTAAAVHVMDVRADQQHLLFYRREVEQRIQQQLTPSPLLAAHLIRGECPPRDGRPSLRAIMPARRRLVHLTHSVRRSSLWSFVEVRLNGPIVVAVRASDGPSPPMLIAISTHTTPQLCTMCCRDAISARIPRGTGPSSALIRRSTMPARCACSANTSSVARFRSKPSAWKSAPMSAAVSSSSASSQGDAYGNDRCALANASVQRLNASVSARAIPKTTTHPHSPSAPRPGFPRPLRHPRRRPSLRPSPSSLLPSSSSSSRLCPAGFPPPPFSFSTLRPPRAHSTAHSSVSG